MKKTRGWNWKQIDKSFHIKQIGIKKIETNSRGKNNWMVTLKFWGVGCEIWGGEGEERFFLKKDINAKSKTY
jgi:hypothetical protein